ncbi:MAG: hypothetical protein R2764_01610 [Bacteroidales bacterium]
MTENIETIKERIASDYNDLSNVSILRHMQDVVAIAVKFLTELFESHKRTVQLIADSVQFGTINWYRAQVLKFQLGYDVDVISYDVGNGDVVYRAGYTVEDATAQIIKHAAIAEALMK